MLFARDHAPSPVLSVHFERSAPTTLRGAIEPSVAWYYYISDFSPYHILGILRSLHFIPTVDTA